MKKRMIGSLVAVGVLAAGQMASAALITGGQVNISGNNYYEVITGGSGNWTVPAGVSSVSVLLVGGGGGGMGAGAGGGGGGFYETTSYSVTPLDSIAVTVGLGGAGAMRSGGAGPYPESYQASPGGQSVFGSLIAYGGQGGDVTWTSSGATSSQGGTSGTNNQNAIGGIVADGPGYYGSGSGVDTKGLNGISVAGGAGLSSMITGATTWYGGGGGAMVNGAGGLGGGGAGSSGSWPSPGNAGTANTGGGGGAGYGGIGGDGGSGVVIVAYTVIPEPASGLLLFASAAGLGLLRRKLRG